MTKECIVFEAIALSEGSHDSIAIIVISFQVDDLFYKYTQNVTYIANLAQFWGLTTFCLIPSRVYQVFQCY